MYAERIVKMEIFGKKKRMGIEIKRIKERNLEITNFKRWVVGETEQKVPSKVWEKPEQHTCATKTGEVSAFPRKN